jgi:hypothetical protein
MNVITDASVIHAWKIVVDYMHNIADIKTTTRHRSSDENRAHTGAESTSMKV